MLNHLYTLEKITIEFQEIIGFKLIEVISQEKDSAVLTFFDNENFRYIKYYGIPHFEAIYMTEKFSKKRSNFSVLFPQITNEFLQDVSLISDTRVICLTFMKYKLYFLLFGN
jgi:predicted ribosome quality control (RQC) complex YloA/Tae2 family protein